MALPRHVTLTADGQLHQRPVDEVTQLRSHHNKLEPSTLQPGRPRLLADIAGDQLDLEMTVTLPPGNAVDLGILATPDGAEQTLIQLDADSDGTVLLRLDRSASSLDPTVDIRPLSGTVGVGHERRVSVRVLIDHSAVEIFVNGRPLTARVYPTRADARCLHLTARTADVVIESLEAWKMDGIWSGPRPIKP